MTTPNKPTPFLPTTARLVAAQHDIEAAWSSFQAATWRQDPAATEAARARLHECIDARADRLTDSIIEMMRGNF